MTMITPSYLGETIEYSSLHACRSTLEDPTAELIVRSALERHESRGLHYTLDYPQTDAVARPTVLSP